MNEACKRVCLGELRYRKQRHDIERMRRREGVNALVLGVSPLSSVMENNANGMMIGISILLDARKPITRVVGCVCKA